MTTLWIVEIDAGATVWTPIAYCFAREDAERLRDADHIRDFGKPARVREYGKAAQEISSTSIKFVDPK